MALQVRLTNVPQMFSEGIDMTPEVKSDRRGAGRLMTAPIGGLSSALAAAFGGRGTPRIAQVDIQRL